MGKGIFGGLFDFDGDGELDALEQAAEFMLFNKIMKDEKKKERDGCDEDYDSEDDR